MPVVLSYEDVRALGRLSYQTGAATGTAAAGAQQRDLLAGIQASRNQTAARLQQVQQRRREAKADRTLRRELTEDEISADLTQARMAYESAEDQQRVQAGSELTQQRMEAIRERAVRERETEREQRLREIEQQRQKTRDRRLHEYDMEEIRLRERLDEDGGGRPAVDWGTLGPGGMADEQRRETEIQQFGRLLDFRTSSVEGPAGATLNSEQILERAYGLTRLPIDELQVLIRKGLENPDGPLAPYIPFLRKVVQRRKAELNDAPAPFSQSGDGRRRPREATKGTGGAAAGMTDYERELQSMSDRELRSIIQGLSG